MIFSISLPWRRRADAAALPVPGSPVSRSDEPGAARPANSAADEKRRGIVRTLEELDAKISECDRAGSDDALRQCFGTFRMEPPGGQPDDPFSEEYRRFQLDLYRRIAGKPYSVANEETVFDI